GRVQVFQADYRVLHDFDTFVLSEDYQLGYAGLLTVRWAETAFGSSRRFLEGTALARYRLYRFDDLATLSAAASIRFQPRQIEGLAPTWVNKRATVEFVNISPFIGIGRIAARALVQVNAADLQHQLITLGGGEGIRGIPLQALVGPNAVLFNLEYRSRSLALRTVHLGFVLFWDVANAYPRLPGTILEPSGIIHTIGFGLRILLPQFNRVPLRIDFGYAINGARPSFPDSISATFGQVTDYRPTLLEQLPD